MLVAYTADQIEAIEEAEEKDRISRLIIKENELEKQRYGEC
jgi:hypothetical protein